MSKGRLSPGFYGRGEPHSGNSMGKGHTYPKILGARGALLSGAMGKGRLFPEILLAKDACLLRFYWRRAPLTCGTMGEGCPGIS